MLESNFQIVTWHGESASYYYVVNSDDSGDWDVLASFTSRREANDFIKGIENVI